MLVLTRKTQEKIQIGDNITLTILRVKGQAVRVGIDAPRELRVIRTELPVEEEAAPASSDRPQVASKSQLKNGAPLGALLAALHAG